MHSFGRVSNSSNGLLCTCFSRTLNEAEIMYSMLQICSISPNTNKTHTKRSPHLCEQSWVVNQTDFRRCSSGPLLP